MTQTKHKNSQTMETKDTCSCEESFTDISFLILREGTLCVSTPPLFFSRLHKPKKPMVNRVKREFDKLKKDNDDTNNKLRILEDRSRRDNLRFHGIEE